MENMKDTNLKLEKCFKSKVTPKEKTTKKFTEKGNNKPPPKQHNDDNYAWNKVSPKQGKKETKHTHNKTYNWCKWYKEWL